MASKRETTGVPTLMRSSVAMLVEVRPKSHGVVNNADPVDFSCAQRLSRREVAAMCAAPSLAEAVAATVQVMVGVPAYSAEFPDPRMIPSRHVVSFSLDGVHYIERFISKAGANAWDEMARDEREGKKRWGWLLSRQSRQIRRMRLKRIQHALDQFALRTRTIDEVVMTAPLDAERWLTDMMATLPLWRDARLAEGHTPESARMLLGLTCPPGTWARVRWTDEGRPTIVWPDPADTSA